MKPLAQQTILITGATDGLGRALAGALRGGRNSPDPRSRRCAGRGVAGKLYPLSHPSSPAFGRISLSFLEQIRLARLSLLERNKINRWHGARSLPPRRFVMRKFPKYLAVGGALLALGFATASIAVASDHPSSPTATPRKADERHDARDASTDVKDTNKDLKDEQGEANQSVNSGDETKEQTDAQNEQKDAQSEVQESQKEGDENQVGEQGETPNGEQAETQNAQDEVSAEQVDQQQVGDDQDQVEQPGSGSQSDHQA
jgi:hypothetical protein